MSQSRNQQCRLRGNYPTAQNQGKVKAVEYVETSAVCTRSAYVKATGPGYRTRIEQYRCLLCLTECCSIT